MVHMCVCVYGRCGWSPLGPCAEVCIFIHAHNHTHTHLDALHGCVSVCVCVHLCICTCVYEHSLMVYDRPKGVVVLHTCVCAQYIAVFALIALVDRNHVILHLQHSIPDAQHPNTVICIHSHVSLCVCVCVCSVPVASENRRAFVCLCAQRLRAQRCAVRVYCVRSVVQEIHAFTVNAVA